MNEIKQLILDFFEENPKGLSENIKVARRGGNISKITKELYEKEVYKKLK